MRSRMPSSPMRILQRSPFAVLGTSMRNSRERGVVIILLIGAIVLFMLLAGLTIGLGIIASIRLSAQNIANAAALAGIEEWVTSATEANNAVRANAVLARVNAVVEQGRPPGFFIDDSNPFGTARFSWSASSEGSGVVVSFGRFYPIDPTPSQAGPCGGGGDEVYPCFVEYKSAAGTQLGSPQAVVNAIRVSVGTPSNNPIIAPFVSVFGIEGVDIAVEATGTLVQRCTAMVVDLSGSSFIDTHPPVPGTFIAPSPFPALLSNNPDGASAAFAYNMLYNQDSGGTRDIRTINCNQVFGAGGINPADAGSVTWCNMRPGRAGDSEYGNVGRPWDLSEYPPGTPWPDAPAHPAAVNPSDQASVRLYSRHHYRDDYRPNQSPFYGNQTFLIDEYVDNVYRGPEPFTSYMQGFNAALRTLQRQQTALDSVAMKGFSGKIVNTIPPFLTGGGGQTLTSDLGYMIQITNLDNRGTFTRTAAGGIIEVAQQLNPNFIDHGFFTVPLSSGSIIPASTNLVEVLDEAIAELTQVCPANAKKQIILATDGVSSCSFLTHLSATERDESEAADDSPRRVCRSNTAPDAWSNYLLSEQQLIGEDGYTIPWAGVGGGPTGLPQVNGSPYPSIIQRLRDDQIAVTVLMAGAAVEPNFRTFLDADVPPPSPWAFTENAVVLPYAKALAFGLTGLHENANLEYVNRQSTVPDGWAGDPDEQAFRNLGSPGFVFRRANGLLARLVMRSGGLWCPLMQPDPDSDCYDGSGNMKASCRTAIQTTSTINVDTPTLAAQCASAAVGHNPYLLAEPFVSCPNEGPAGTPSC